jgi:hypothetical protein
LHASIHFPRAHLDAGYWRFRYLEEKSRSLGVSSSSSKGIGASGSYKSSETGVPPNPLLIGCLLMAPGGASWERSHPSPPSPLVGKEGHGWRFHTPSRPVGRASCPGTNRLEGPLPGGESGQAGKKRRWIKPNRVSIRHTRVVGTGRKTKMKAEDKREGEWITCNKK